MAGDKIVTFRYTISGPRWARTDIAIKDGCFVRGITCRVERETSFLREHIRFEVSGKESSISELIKSLNNCIEEWNK